MEGLCLLLSFHESKCSPRHEGQALRQQNSRGESVKIKIIITDRRLFPRENGQHTRDEWSAKRGLFSTLPRGVRVGLACRDVCAGLTCCRISLLKKEAPSLKRGMALSAKGRSAAQDDLCGELHSYRQRRDGAGTTALGRGPRFHREANQSLGIMVEI